MRSLKYLGSVSVLVLSGGGVSLSDITLCPALIILVYLLLILSFRAGLVC